MIGQAIRITLVGLSAALFVGGCAVESKFTHSDPTTVNISNEKIIKKPFRRVWDEYVRELSKEFFVINNISKESRIINVSFSTGNPGQFVDCGKSTRTATHPTIGTKTVSYETANNSSFYMTSQPRNELWLVNRVTRLTGRSNVYIAPQGRATLIRVNAKYVWTVNVTMRSNLGRSANHPITMDFSTNSPGQYTEGGRTYSCRSTGELERRLLNLVSD